MSKDIDKLETQEWKDAIHSVINKDSPERANYLLKETVNHALSNNEKISVPLNTPYVNTIETAQEPEYPGDITKEDENLATVRWNAAAMVVKACRYDADLGGHIGTFTSSATLYDVGFNHFWRAPSESHIGDLIFYQGHSSPGIYARSFLEGRLTSEQLTNFRQEAFADGLSSYPHPWLMPEYWQFPTVSMGLGPIQAIYQARFMHYLNSNNLLDKELGKVWCFCGDGEMDEPESTGALGIAGREKLDNLIFVISCNLQRLDGPVRGNGKVIQELERIFVGAGWQVIKVMWGAKFDALISRDKSGQLLDKLTNMVDGEFQNCSAHGGAHIRATLFDTPELSQLVADLSDEELEGLTLGGHDRTKLYAAYDKAVKSSGKPVVVLAHTIKGYKLGKDTQGQNTVHNAKKLSDKQLIDYKNNLNIPISDEVACEPGFYHPGLDSEQVSYVKQLRTKLNGYIPQRRMSASNKMQTPPLDYFSKLMQGSGDRQYSTTTVFVRLISMLCKDKSIGKNIVPIVPDEARTFGMEGLFRQLGIYAADGQLYEPVDKKQVMYYKEAKDGQILQEGLNEAGAFCSWLAAATAYSVYDTTMIPFYIYYSMFGFQRIGDLAWAAGDSRARGFLIGATSGRTTLNGEGLQHEDGHSHILAKTVPNCVSYDPTFGYELTVIIQNGLKRMLEDNEDIYYYITTMNENYIHPDMPEGSEDGIVRGMYLFKECDSKQPDLQLLGCGTIFNEVIKAADILQQTFNFKVNIWGVTSFNELAKEGNNKQRYNVFNPDNKSTPYITECLEPEVPTIAATDYIRDFSEQVRAYVPGPYITLGTDGFGRSDSRANLRKFFEVDSKHIIVTALSSLVEQGKFSAQKLHDVIEEYQINSEYLDLYSR